MAQYLLLVRCTVAASGSYDIRRAELVSGISDRDRGTDPMAIYLLTTHICTPQHNPPHRSIA